MCQYLAIGSNSTYADPYQQGAMEPAPILVAAFNVDIGRPGDIPTFSQDCFVTGTGVKPDI